MSMWKKRYKTTRFSEPVPCPYSCGESFNTSLQLARHVLRHHNFSYPNLTSIVEIIKTLHGDELKKFLEDAWLLTDDLSLELIKKIGG